MQLINYSKLLLIFSILFIAQPAPQSKMLIGKWVSDKPLYDNLLEVTFAANGNYTEVTKSAKTNFVTAKLDATYIIVNDSTLVIKSPDNTTTAHRMHFMKKDLLRFYPVKRKPGAAISPLDMYNFVKK